MTYLLYFMLALCAILPAQTGKISGVATDKTTGETLSGVNVHINHTTLGASTDVDGFYVILKVPPGFHSIRTEYVGYRTQQIRRVQVRAGHLTELNFQLEESVEASEVVEVIAERLPIRMSETYSRQIHTSTRITNLPTSTVQSTIGLTSGVVKAEHSETIFVRCGRGESTTVIVDGVVVRGRYDGPVPTEREIETDTDRFSKIVENRFVTVRDVPLSTFSIDVDAASYTVIRRNLTYGILPRPETIRPEEVINFFDYKYDSYTGDKPFSVTTEVSDCPWQDGDQLVHIGLKGRSIAKDQVKPNRLTFLVDVSGSMGATNKLPLVKSSLKLLVNELGENDHVAIVVYAGAAGLVLDMVSTTRKDRILRAIDRLSSGGSTAGGEGIKLAYAVAENNFNPAANNRVILTTDGDFNVGVDSPDELKDLITKYKDTGIFLTALGFGMGNYRDDLLEELSNAGNGNYAYIDDQREAERMFVQQLSGTLGTIAKDVKIQVEFDPEAVKSYRLIGYVNRKLDAKDFDNDQKDAGEIGAGHTVTALYQIAPVHKSGDVNRNLLTLRIRYKAPQEGISEKIEFAVKDVRTPLIKSSDRFRFSAAAAGFAMILNRSPRFGNGSIDQVIDLADGAKGEERFGYRTEFVKLAKQVKQMMANQPGLTIRD